MSTIESVINPISKNTPNISVYVDSKSQDGLDIQFTLTNTNHSIANAIRRVIITNIPCVVFKTFPHEENLSTIHKNTSRLNNEILRQRLECIPVHITDENIDLNE